jgi:hypothetical protein
MPFLPLRPRGSASQAGVSGSSGWPAAKAACPARASCLRTSHSVISDGSRIRPPRPTSMYKPRRLRRSASSAGASRAVMNCASSPTGIAPSHDPTSGQAVWHSGDEQPLDLLQLVPLQHPADRRPHPHGLGHHRQQDQAGCLACLFDRERCQGIGPRRTAGLRQHLGVVQQALRVPRRGDGAPDQHRCRRGPDGTKIHTSSLTSRPAPRSSGRRA